MSDKNIEKFKNVSIIEVKKCDFFTSGTVTVLYTRVYEKNVTL